MAEDNALSLTAEAKHYVARREKMRDFLEAYLKLRTLGSAAKQVGIKYGVWNRWAEIDKEFADAFREAKILVGDRLEDEAIRRATRGWREPIFQGGKLVGHRRMFSDTLLIFLLKGLKPEKYRDRYEHSGPGGGPIPFTLEQAMTRGFEKHQSQKRIDTGKVEKEEEED